jgi:hypothetical protein
MRNAADGSVPASFYECSYSGQAVVSDPASPIELIRMSMGLIETAAGTVKPRSGEAGFAGPGFIRSARTEARI